MSTTELAIVAGIFAALILLPLVVLFIVRRMVPLDDATEGDEEPAIQFDSLRDVWESAVPHLTELRDRLVKAAIGVAIGTVLGAWLVYSAPLGKPLPEILIDQFVPPQVNLQSIGTAETFVSYMGIALVVGFALAIPFIAYQVVAFIAPGLRSNEKRAVYVSLPFVTELFLAGVAFGWFFTVPAALYFLLDFGTSDRIVTQPSLSSFLSTVSKLMLWNGVVFELPAIIYLMARIGVVNTRQLSATRRYAIVVIVIVAAIITPTGDPFNLMLLAVPMYLLYELGIVLTRFVPKRVEQLAQVVDEAGQRIGSG